MEKKAASSFFYSSASFLAPAAEKAARQVQRKVHYSHNGTHNHRLYLLKMLHYKEFLFFIYCFNPSEFPTSVVRKGAEIDLFGPIFRGSPQ